MSVADVYSPDQGYVQKTSSYPFGAVLLADDTLSAEVLEDHYQELVVKSVDENGEAECFAFLVPIDDTVPKEVKATAIADWLNGQ